MLSLIFRYIKYTHLISFRYTKYTHLISFRYTKYTQIRSQFILNSPLTFLFVYPFFHFLELYFLYILLYYVIEKN